MIFLILALIFTNFNFLNLIHSNKEFSEIIIGFASAMLQILTLQLVIHISESKKQKLLVIPLYFFLDAITLFLNQYVILY